MEIKLKLNGENVVLNISDVTVNGKPVDVGNNEQLKEPEFKDGDFCYSTNGRIYYVFIFKSKINSDKSKYHALMYLGWTVDASFKINDECISKQDKIRLASNKEKELLLKARKNMSQVIANEGIIRRIDKRLEKNANVTMKGNLSLVTD